MTTFEIIQLIFGTGFILGLGKLLIQSGKLINRIDNMEKRLGNIEKMIGEIQFDISLLRDRVARIEGALWGIERKNGTDQK